MKSTELSTAHDDIFDLSLHEVKTYVHVVQCSRMEFIGKDSEYVIGLVTFHCMHIIYDVLLIDSSVENVYRHICCCVPDDWNCSQSIEL